VFLDTILTSKVVSNAQQFRPSVPPAQWWEQPQLAITALTLTTSHSAQLVLSVRSTFPTALHAFKTVSEELTVPLAPRLIMPLMITSAQNALLLFQTVILVNKMDGDQLLVSAVFPPT